MRFRPRTWLLFSLLLFAAAYWFWTYGEKVSASRRTRAAQSAVAEPTGPALAKIADTHNSSKSKSYHLSNTRLTEKELLRSNHAILLRNATIDTDRPLKLDIPAHLRAKGAPGSYIVQSQEGMDQSFRNKLKQDGVEVVSYIPNNAALVQATPEQARQMAADAAFQAVLPYEPYYKLSANLLPSAVAQEQPQSEALNVTTFPGQRDAALAALQGLGAKLMGEDNGGPFGTTLTVMAPPESLVAIAQLPLAHEIEPYAQRRTLNDLTRVTMGISTNTLYTTPNYLNLTGANVTVNMNDTGVDSTHPDFKGGTGIRLIGATSALTDQSSGHGTAVAGTIMGNGSQSLRVTQPVPGSVPGAGFQGKATNAMLFVQSLGLVVGATVDDAFQVGGSLVSDGSLQTSASTNLGPTNLISNNSWGYEGVTTYDMHAASFDQATRDAQPLLPGEQPLLFVVAAGGEGNGDDFGGSGTAGSILSPATAKNVITVGAIDSDRFITNQVDLNDQTNDIFFNWTDNDDLVAWFSSCGNVGIGTEGTNGRFKPDVVAPGVFTITCRATNYIDPTNAAYLTTYPFPNQLVLPGKPNYISLNIPADSAALAVQITPNPQSPTPFPNLEILGNDFTPPTTVLSTSNFLILSNQLTPGEWTFGITTQPGQIQPVAYDATFYLFETNDLGVASTNALGYFSVISNLNSVLKPAGYVYQYGTSMSAGAVSGMLALMQEFLETRMGMTNPTPALLKAMLINGSRNLEQQYDFNTHSVSANEQGWGLPNLPNSVPGSLTNTTSTSMLLVNQASSNALATGQSQSYVVRCTDQNVTNFPIRVTLVWTDPPGDPAAGIALVNNLDLVVTDSSTNIWLGNDFFGGDTFTENNTGNLPDALNNVQNVYIDTTNVSVVFPLTVTVLGTRVNVNAATTVTNLIAQDYALVISSDDTALTGPLHMTRLAPNSAQPPHFGALAAMTSVNGGPLLSAPLMAYAQGNFALVTIASNGLPLLHQRVGANEPNLYANGPLYGSASDTNGNLSQWHFFVFTNDQWNATNSASNVAFTTFLPPDLATQISPRTNGADIDMYVSTNVALLTLDSNAIANSVLDGMASLSRSGTETVLLTNSTANEVYYVGIKSEDQQGGDFGFYAVAQQTNFSTLNSDGSVTATGTGVPVPIPDNGTGPPALVFAFLINPLNPAMVLRNVTATVGIEHGNPSDLYGVLQHNQTQVVLNDFSGAPGGFTNTYNDLNDNTVPGSVTADGPGTLRNYINSSGQGMWMLTETDNAYTQSGQVNSFSVTGYPQPPQLGFLATIGAQQWFDDFVIVPDDATNMTISVSYVSGIGPVGIFLTNQDNVGFNDFGVEPISPPGGFLNYSIKNSPPLAGGVWYYGIYNYASSPVTVYVQITFGLSLVPNLVQTYTNTTLMPLPTDATTNSSQICISNGQQLVDLSVGLRADDPNLNDLVFQLTSPQGTSIVLFENRGGLLATNLGLTLTNDSSTNFVYTTFTEDTNLADVPIKFAPPPYATNSITPLTQIYSSGFEDATNGVYTVGETFDGWTVATNEVSVVTDPNVAYDGNNFLALASGRIKQTFTTLPGASYELRYYARGSGLANWWPAEGNAIDLVGNAGFTSTDITFDVGEVGRAFAFANPLSVIDFGTNLGNFDTNDFSIDFWIKDADTNDVNIAVLEKQTSFQAGSYFDIFLKDGTVHYDDPAVHADGGFLGQVTDGLYHHVAVVRQAATVTIYLDGSMAGSANAATIGDINNLGHFYVGLSPFPNIVHFTGDLDELDLWQRALSPAEVYSIYAAKNLGKYNTNSLLPNFQVSFDGISTNTIIMSNFAGPWQAGTNSFIATNIQTTIELAGNPIGVLLDDVELVQLPFTNNENHYLPEEPLTPFIGENPQGCWTLSVWDTRQDSSLPTNGALLGWTLQLTTSSTNVNLIVLSNGVPYTTPSVPPNDIIYFGVDVPATANFATNSLIGSGPMNLFFNQNALPTGTLPGDVTLVTLPAAGGTGIDTLSTQGAPPALLPGRRYFLGVQNTGTAPASFTLQVNFDVSASANIIPLTNNIAYSTTGPTGPPFGGPAYFSFTVPSNAVLVTFQAFSTFGVNDLYARNSLPVPSPLSFDYESSGEFEVPTIVITTNSAPVPLPAAGVNGTLPVPPTTWYLTLDGGTLGYTLLATYVTSADMDIVNLNAQPNFTSDGTATKGFPTNLMYSFTVTNTNAEAVEFTVTNAASPPFSFLALLAGDGTFPTPQDFYIGSFPLSGMNPFVVIATNAALTNLTGTTWYLAVPNNQMPGSPATVNYSITATVLTNGSPTSFPLYIGASISSPTNGFIMYWNAVPGESYQIQVSTNLTQWSVATNIIAQTAVGVYTDSVPVISQPSRYFRILAP